jgi:hypothetical protein
MPKGPYLSIEENWAAQAKLKAELAELESGALTYGRRARGADWEDITAERIAQVKSDLIALKIEMNLGFWTARKMRGA